ncbi:MAG: hypothetical protein K0R59_1325 [Sphingobacterium sp.]|jgi:hypothetical protein|nr:hypothetical protein [Sphingobacterium sp.]
MREAIQGMVIQRKAGLEEGCSSIGIKARCI